ncbi:MAG: hypothetical protein HFI30_03580 [Lachnospiraceae bacterium]|jgi:uroporphyrinogen-III decarboxylase|nr:hypothetical protein [Lachnospiraceae bacterium]
MTDILKDAMDGKEVARAPVLAKIWLDLAAGLMARDWLSLFEDPDLAAATVVEAARLCRSDGARVFLFARRKICREADDCWQWKEGRRLGRVDQQGGGATLLSSRLDFDLEDPEMVIHYQAFRCRNPILETREDVERFRIPSLAEFERLYGNTVKRCREAAGGEVSLIGDCNSGSLAFCVAMHGMGETLLDLYDEPKLIHAMMKKGMELSLMQARFFLSQGIRILRYNDSVANMKVISPDCWREFVAPCITQFCEEVHALCPTARVYCHICGDVLPVIPDLVATGLDCIAPLDPLGGRSIREIREAVGDSYMLMGGVNTLSFVQNTPTEIREEAKSCIREGFRQGHFAVGSGCSMPRASTLAGIRALAEASRELAL